MKVINVSLTLTAAVGNQVCASQKPAAGGTQSLTINGAGASGGVATFDIPRHASVTSSGDDSARTFTITGTNRFGVTITETIVGANPTSYGTKNFKTVTAVTVDGNTAGNITVGMAALAETAWIPLNLYSGPHIGVTVALSSAASLTYTVEGTMSDVQAEGFTGDQAVTFILDAAMSGRSSSAVVQKSAMARAIRLSITAWTSGSATLSLLQQGSYR